VDRARVCFCAAVRRSNRSTYGYRKVAEQQSDLRQFQGKQDVGRDDGTVLLEYSECFTVRTMAATHKLHNKTGNRCVDRFSAVEHDPLALNLPDPISACIARRFQFLARLTMSDSVP
jgi:hypothetical protein